MSVTLVPNSVFIDRTGPSWLVESKGYDILAELSRGQLARENSRADLEIGIPRSASSLEQMVVIKRFYAEPTQTDWLALVAELEFATALRHDNVIRTLGIGLESGRYFSISEYVEGATLQACLEWAAATGTRLGNPVVARILLGILDALKHASLVAQSRLSQALARASIAVDDVFISYDGQVKLLGFKGTHGGGKRAASAVDVLLEQQLTPELRRVLPRLIHAVDDTACDPAREIRNALLDDGPARDEGAPSSGVRTHLPRSVGPGNRIASSVISGRGSPGSEGRAELSGVMRQVLRNERAQRALLVAKSFSQLRGPVRRSSALTGEEEAPPLSGFRRIAPGLGGTAPVPVARPAGVTQPLGLVRPAQR
ncbi:MAG: protein kinase [Deltaproteobacteria bacterium]